MSKTFTSDQESVVDLAIRTYGSVEAVMDLLRDNAIDLDNDLLAGLQIQVNDSRVNELALTPPVTYTQPKKDKVGVLISEGQSSIDVTLQEYGSVEGLLDLLRDNNLSIDQQSTAGSRVLVKPAQILRKDIVTWFQNRSMKINMGLSTAGAPPVTHRIFSRTFNRRFN